MKVRIGLVILLALALLSGGWIGQALASPQAPDVAPGLINYQGYLTDAGGQAFNGSATVVVSIFTQANDGAAIWSETHTGVAVNRGYFSVMLGSVTALNASYFSGATRYLEVSVDTGSGAVVLPRQQFTAVPYAFQANSVPWSGVTGIPAGFADGGDAGDYAQVVTVAKSGAQFTSIQAALDSIADAGASKRYLVWIAPGEYSEQVTMKAYVDLQGSGERTTTIKTAGFAVNTTGTLVGASSAEVRFLRVENTGGNQFSLAIYTSNADTRFTHVTAVASGAAASNYGVYNNGNAPVFTDVSILVTCSGGSNCLGMYHGGSNTALRSSSIRVIHSGHGFIYGIHNSGGVAVWEDTSVETIGPNAGGSGNNLAVFNQGGSPTLLGVRIKAFGGNNSFGIYNSSGQPVIRGSRIQASNGGGTDEGIYSSTAAGQKLSVLDSEIISTDTTLENQGAGEALIASTLLDGGAIFGTGIETCAGVYNESYTFFAAACP